MDENLQEPENADENSSATKATFTDCVNVTVTDLCKSVERNSSADHNSAFSLSSKPSELNLSSKLSATTGSHELTETVGAVMQSLVDRSCFNGLGEPVIMIETEKSFIDMNPKLTNKHANTSEETANLEKSSTNATLHVDLSSISESSENTKSGDSTSSNKESASTKIIGSNSDLKTDTSSNLISMKQISSGDGKLLEIDLNAVSDNPKTVEDEVLEESEDVTKKVVEDSEDATEKVVDEVLEESEDVTEKAVVDEVLEESEDVTEKSVEDEVLEESEDVTKKVVGDEVLGQRGIITEKAIEDEVLEECKDITEKAVENEVLEECKDIAEEVETDRMLVECKDNNKLNLSLLNTIVSPNSLPSRKRAHSDDEEEEFEITSAAKKCFQALCESSEVMEDLSLPLSDAEPLSLDDFPKISPTLLIQTEAASEKPTKAVIQSTPDLSIKVQDDLMEEKSDSTKSPIIDSEQDKLIVAPKDKINDTNVIENEVKENSFATESNDSAIVSNADVATNDVLESSLKTSNEQSKEVDDDDDDDIEILSPEGSNVSTNENDDEPTETLAISENGNDGNCTSLISEEQNNEKDMTVSETCDNGITTSDNENDDGAFSESNKEDVITFENDDKKSVEMPTSECDEISIKTPASENDNKEDCEMAVVSESPDGDDCELTTKSEDPDHNSVAMSEEDNEDSTVTAISENSNMENITTAVTTSENHDESCTTVATSEDKNDMEMDVTNSVSELTTPIKSESSIKEDLNSDDSSISATFLKNEILDEDFEDLPSDLIIDLKAGTFTMPIEALVNFFSEKPKVENNLESKNISDIEAVELRKLLEEERERGKQVRIALRAVYSQQRALYRACGYVPKVDTRTVGVMTRISDDNDCVTQDNICDVQISTTSPTTSQPADATTKDSMTDLSPLLKNNQSLTINSIPANNRLDSPSSSNTEKKPNNVSVSVNESFKKPNQVTPLASNGTISGSSQASVLKEKLSTKNTESSNQNSDPQIIDLTDDDDPIVPIKKEVTSSKESAQAHSLVNSNNAKPVYLPSSVQIIPSQTSNSVSNPNNVQIIRNATSTPTRLTYLVQQPSALFPVGGSRPTFNSPTANGLPANMVIFRPVEINIPTTQSGLAKGVTGQQFVARTGHQVFPRPLSRPAFVQAVTQPGVVKNFGSGSSQITLTPRFPKHPAPLPQPPTYPTNKNLKALPPKPSLKMNRTSSGISLSWSMTLHNGYADISAYQLYAYQEGSGRVDSSLWKKVSDIKAMPLPMACTLTQFVEGHKYHFAMRAMDVHRRVGHFSDPITVHHRPNKTVVNK